MAEGECCREPGSGDFMVRTPIHVMSVLQVTDAELPALRAKIIETRQAVHKSTEEEVSKRWAFEEAVSLLLFHCRYVWDTRNGFTLL